MAPTTARKQAAPRGGALVATTTAPTVRPIFGIDLTVNGKPVQITASDLDTSKGFEFTLPDPVSLGTIADLGAALKPFGIDFPDVSTFPKPLDSIAQYVTSIVFGVEEFHVKVPPTATPANPTMFTFEMSATLPAPVVLFGGLSITGAVFGASNEPAPAESAQPALT